MQKQNVNIVWLRRDLRLKDNTALIEASKTQLPVLLLFIFDDNILKQLNNDDSRVSFIYQQLKELNEELKRVSSSILIKKGNPSEVIKNVLSEFNVEAIFANEDYEPYAINRDQEIQNICKDYGSDLFLFKDQVIFAKNEILKKDQTPYTVFTPYKKQWLKKFNLERISIKDNTTVQYLEQNSPFLDLNSLGFTKGKFKVKDYDLSRLQLYTTQRDTPAKDIGTYIGPHLRFGTLSIREIATIAQTSSETFLNELIWREFFMQILYHFPHSANDAFKPQYKFIPWLNKEDDFKNWYEGNTGYPMVDAGMRELNSTGYMHNRVRMITASFLCKHLLIDWRWGETYFAGKLLDYEMSSNVGNWQWAASTGCDAVPYFRIFNPELQQQRFDPDFKYIKKWIPEYGTSKYPKPMVDHKTARKRAIETYKGAIIK